MAHKKEMPEKQEHSHINITGGTETTYLEKRVKQVHIVHIL
jgi:hypothetical protein